MANPQWPSFPGVPNMTVDGQGRPQVQDLIPGKQLGTPLDAALINPLIASVCGLWDEQENTLISGTSGLVAGDHPGVGLHTRGSDNAVLYSDKANGWRSLALASDVQAESQRAQNAESQLVLGTRGLDDYSLRITGIKSQYSDTAKQNPIGIEYMDDGGLYQLAITRDYADAHYAAHSDVQAGQQAWQSALSAESQRAQTAEAQAISGTTGLAPGDHQGLGLHTQGGSNAVLYNDSANGWRPLVIGAGNNTDGTVQAAVFSAGANGDRSAPTFIDDNGQYVGLLPAQNPVVNGALKTDAIASVGGAAVSVSYDGGGRVAFQNDGNMVGYSPGGGVNFALGTGSSMVQGPLAVTGGGNALSVTPTTLVNGYPRGAIGWNGTSWYPGGDGAIICPSGHMLMESSKSNDPSFTQRFTVDAVHGQTITFPQQFSNDNVQVSALPVDGLYNHIHFANFISVNRFGMMLSLNYWDNGSTQNEHTPTPIMIIAIGAK